MHSSKSRTKKIKTIEERIGEARDEVFRAKDRYDTTVKKLNELLEKSGRWRGMAKATDW